MSQLLALFVDIAPDPSPISAVTGFGLTGFIALGAAIVVIIVAVLIIVMRRNKK
ncbi:MAG: hypothetical protein LBH56_02675 [Coriobacteriales bacterium]|jgi:hypothetical protein|nr:hypothetical protein [Coriobacteriales bacterium]